MDTTTTPIDTSVMPTIHTFFRREVRLAGGVSAGSPTATSCAPRWSPSTSTSSPRRCTSTTPPRTRCCGPSCSTACPRSSRPCAADGGPARPGRRLLAEIGDLRRAGPRRPSRPPRSAGRIVRPALRPPRRAPRAEEERLLPIAARAVTQAEWDAMGERGRTHTRKSELSLALGMFQYEGDPAVISQMLAEARGPCWIVPRFPPRLPQARAGHPRDGDALSGAVSRAAAPAAHRSGPSTARAPGCGASPGRPAHRPGGRRITVRLGQQPERVLDRAEEERRQAAGGEPGRRTG